MCSHWPRQIWHFLFTGIKLLPPNLRGQHPMDNTFIHTVFALWRGSGNSIWGRLAQVLCADWFYQYAKTYTESINLVFFSYSIFISECVLHKFKDQSFSVCILGARKALISCWTCKLNTHGTFKCSLHTRFLQIQLNWCIMNHSVWFAQHHTGAVTERTISFPQTCGCHSICDENNFNQ